ncbi:MAG: hypothetical protein ACE5FS_02635 [Paracoccaceae bacterium]
MMSRNQSTIGQGRAVGFLRIGIVLCGVVIVSACAQTDRQFSRATGLPQGSPTQLELQAELTPEEYGRYSTGQLAEIKAILDGGDTSRRHQRQRIETVKRRGRGGSTIFGFSF